MALIKTTTTNIPTKQQQTFTINITRLSKSTNTSRANKLLAVLNKFDFLPSVIKDDITINANELLTKLEQKAKSEQQLNDHEAAQEVNEEPFDPNLEATDACAASDALARGASGGVGLDEPTI